MSHFVLKIIAVVAMTIDHIAAIGFEVPIIADNQNLMRIIGRSAAPLFLFCIVQSAANTRNRWKMMARLYLAGLCTGLLNGTVNYLWGNTIGVYHYDCILYDFFYVILLIELFEQLQEAKQGQLRQALPVLLCGIILIVGPMLLWRTLKQLPIDSYDANVQYLISDLIDGCIPARLSFGWPFVILGVVMYIAHTKKKQCLVYFGFCLLCLAGWIAVRCGYRELLYISWIRMYTSFTQCMMVFALPFMVMYNGQRGKAIKWPFYMYYPLHRHVIAAATALFMGLPHV